MDISEAFARVPNDLAIMSKEELAVVLHGLACKVACIEAGWDARESFVSSHIPAQSECPSITKLFAALEDYRHLSALEDGALRISQVSGKQGSLGGCVYVLEFSDGHIKIGNSINPDERTRSVAGANQSSLRRKWVSQRIFEAYRLEYMAHKHFAGSRAGGEFFKASFDDAVEWIKHQIREKT